MKTLEQQIGGKCVHFNGLGGSDSKRCDAGVVYLTVENKSVKGFERWPCFREGADVPCEKRHFPTPEEVASECAERRASIERITTAMRAAVEDAKKYGYGKGKGGNGFVLCPVCMSGDLHYSVASYNGHMWGKCSTKDCVAWMQ